MTVKETNVIGFINHENHVAERVRNVPPYSFAVNSKEREGRSLKAHGTDYKEGAGHP